MTGRVCVDASVLLKIVLPEPLAQEASDLLAAWDAAGFELVAPSLLPYEVTSTLFKNVQQGVLPEQAARDGLSLLKQIDIQMFLPDDLHDQAWETARSCGQRVMYDAYYLALAQLLDCEYWTADRRFYGATQGALHVSYDRIRLLGLDRLTGV
jgi:predicted nucleic acid-binding protein